MPVQVSLLMVILNFKKIFQAVSIPKFLAQTLEGYFSSPHLRIEVIQKSCKTFRCQFVLISKAFPEWHSEQNTEKNKQEVASKTQQYPIGELFPRALRRNIFPDDLIWYLFPCNPKLKLQLRMFFLLAIKCIMIVEKVSDLGISAHFLVDCDDSNSNI